MMSILNSSIRGRPRCTSSDFNASGSLLGTDDDLSLTDDSITDSAKSNSANHWIDQEQSSVHSRSSHCSPPKRVVKNVIEHGQLSPPRQAILCKGRSFRVRVKKVSGTATRPATRPGLTRSVSSRCVTNNNTHKTLKVRLVSSNQTNKKNKGGSNNNSLSNNHQGDHNPSSRGLSKKASSLFRSASCKPFPVSQFIYGDTGGEAGKEESLRSALRRDHSIQDLTEKAEQLFQDIICDDGIAAGHNKSFSSGGYEGPQKLVRQLSLKKLGDDAVERYNQMMEELDDSCHDRQESSLHNQPDDLSLRPHFETGAVAEEEDDTDNDDDNVSVNSFAA